MMGVTLLEKWTVRAGDRYVGDRGGEFRVIAVRGEWGLAESDRYGARAWVRVTGRTLRWNPQLKAYGVRAGLWEAVDVGLPARDDDELAATLATGERLGTGWIIW